VGVPGYRSEDPARTDARPGRPLCADDRRDQELLELKQAATDLIAHNQGQFVLITGEAGLGKSRLTNEFKVFLEQRSCLGAGRQQPGLPAGALLDIPGGVVQLPGPTYWHAASANERALEPFDKPADG